MHPRTILSLSLCLLGFSGLLSQSQLTLYHMAHVPQAYGLNPGHLPFVETYVGLPLVSGIHFAGELDGLTYDDIDDALDAGGYDFDLDRFGQSLDSEVPAADVDLGFSALSVGFRIKTGFVQVAIADRLLSQARVDDDLITQLADLQRQRVPDLATRTDLASSDLSGRYIRSFGLGYSHVFSERLTAGLRLHYLTGQAMLRTENNGFAFGGLNEAGFFPLEGVGLIEGAGLAQFDDFSGDFFGVGDAVGRGFAIDLGASFWLTEQIELGASILSLGRMTWRENLSQVELSAESEYAEAFSGEDLESYGAAWEMVYDDLILGDDTDRIGTLGEGLPSRFFLSGQYVYSERSSVGLVLQLRQRLIGSPTFGGGISYNTRFGRVLGLSAAYTFTRHQPVGIGLGFNLDLGPVQLYGVTDGVFALFGYSGAQYATGQLGLNLVFGKMLRPEQRGYYANRFQAL